MSIEQDTEDATLEYGAWTLDLKRSGFNSEKETSQFIRKCIGIVRQTPEYRDWTSYVKDTLGYRTCAFTNENSDELTIDIHHHPLTIFDMVTIVVNTYMNNAKEFSSLDIATDILYLHFTNKVGFIPIVTSLHEKYHNGYLMIPPKFIHGKWDHLLTTPGYVVASDIVSKSKELMDDKNNLNCEYLNWQKVGIENNA